jgi:hypothetical protein
MLEQMQNFASSTNHTHLSGHSLDVYFGTTERESRHFAAAGFSLCDDWIHDAFEQRNKSSKEAYNTAENGSALIGKRIHGRNVDSECCDASLRATLSAKTCDIADLRGEAELRTSVGELRQLRLSRTSHGSRTVHDTPLPNQFPPEQRLQHHSPPRTRSPSLDRLRGLGYIEGNEVPVQHQAAFNIDSLRTSAKIPKVKKQWRSKSSANLTPQFHATRPPESQVCANVEQLKEWLRAFGIHVRSALPCPPSSFNITHGGLSTEIIRHIPLHSVAGVLMPAHCLCDAIRCLHADRTSNIDRGGLSGWQPSGVPLPNTVPSEAQWYRDETQDPGSSPAQHQEDLGGITALF